ncbi:MFS transporter [Rhodoplanes sp. TEM]|uniref:MFS transporter n=1 Tax=Rhodoplanes tepidamans TaxID=200616 RepID=A0ABT5JJ10_RHOTP|nr:MULTISPECIES: MFS transporter [Rhodoplanes]MDC7789703.1 MFS transporter [Rhodoplanes tepidamans]MDC7984382.1 MFS transporter [Rhodoplanes sp. TEM]MDQ0358348.1 MFS family permease [Rhodoplanes tepidamans]
MVLVAGFAVLFVGGGARFAIGLTLKSVVDDLGWGRSELGLAVALFQVVSAGCMFLAGRLSDRANPRLVLAGGLLLAGLGIGAMSLVAAPWHALVLYGVVFAAGNGAASLIPVSVMVTRAFPERTGLANAAVTAGMSLGQLVMIGVLAAVLVAIGWRSVFVWLGAAHLVLLPLLLGAIRGGGDRGEAHTRRAASGLTIREAARTRPFWALLAVYAICGLDDFFVSTHVVALAQDRGLDAYLAGNLLAVMGLTALLGVMAAGAWSDRAGPLWPAAASFVARLAVFGLILVDQSTVSVAVFGLVFGATFLVTAPLTVVFVATHFGSRHLGALTGLITMVHHIAGGLGAWIGAVTFDRLGGYDAAFALMLASNVVVLALLPLLRRPQVV